jgi:hypothetical protein
LFNDYRNTNQPAKSVADSQSIRRCFKEEKRKSAKGEREKRGILICSEERRWEKRNKVR